LVAREESFNRRRGDQERRHWTFGGRSGAHGQSNWSPTESLIAWFVSRSDPAAPVGPAPQGRPAECSVRASWPPALLLLPGGVPLRL